MRFETISGNDLLQNCHDDFEETALQLFHYQYEHNELYRAYTDALKVNKSSVQQITQIPFLPISFFKSHQVTCTSKLDFAQVFDSSGTTGMQPSKHYVLDAQLYDTVSLAGFEAFYGNCSDWVILALLPSYLERKTSSLVYMVKMLMDKSNHLENGFYLNEWESLQQQLLQLKSEGKKVLLLGVSFALLDFAKKYPMDLSGVCIMETGGMKGRQAEWTRGQLHEFLKQQWNVSQIHSEYGMTELLSQAYAVQEGLFKPIASMRALLRDIQDPLETNREGSGVLNIIDLANVHSCAFIATEDLGKVYADGSFEVLGRMDFAALRGCSLMAL